MSVRSISRVWDGSRHSGTELLMLLAIADFADDDGRAYPSVASLARKCRMQPRNARYILNTLQESGELRVQLNAGPHASNVYRLMFAAMPGAEGSQPLQHSAPLQQTAGVQRSAGVQAGAGLHSIAATPATHCREPLQPIAAKPSLNRQEPSKARAGRPADQLTLPESIPADAWAAFVEMRKSIRKPMTLNAQRLMVAKLERLRAEGEDPRAVLEQSVMSSWTDCYAVKSGGRGRTGRDPMAATDTFAGAV